MRLKLVGRRALSVLFLFCHLFFLSFLSLNSLFLPQTMTQAYPLTLLVTARVKEISNLCPRKMLVSCFYAIQGAEQTLLTVPSIEKQSCFSAKSGTMRTFIPVGLSCKQLCRRSICRGKGEQVRAHGKRIWQQDMANVPNPGQFHSSCSLPASEVIIDCLADFSDFN